MEIESKDQYKERLLLLKNQACCAVIRVSSTSNMYIVLSPTGAYVHIYFQGNVFQHMTRFTPVRFQADVETLLNFRNMFADKPYLCTRFHNVCGGKNDADMTDLGQTKPNWRRIPTSSQQNILSVCPFQKRLCIKREVYVTEDSNCLEIPIRGTELARSTLCTVLTLHPMYRLKQDAISSLHSVALNSQSQGCGTGCNQKAPLAQNVAYPQLCEESTTSARILSELMSGMSFLGCNKDNYPVNMPVTTSVAAAGKLTGIVTTSKSSGMLVIAECIDGDVFLIGRLPCDANNAKQSALRNTLVKNILGRFDHRISVNVDGDFTSTSMTKDALEVEAWVEINKQEEDFCANAHKTKFQEADQHVTTTIVSQLLCRRQSPLVRSSSSDAASIISDVPAITGKTGAADTHNHHDIKNTANRNAISHHQYAEAILRLRGEVFTIDIIDESTTLPRSVQFHSSLVQYELQRRASLLAAVGDTNDYPGEDSGANLHRNHSIDNANDSAKSETNAHEENDTATIAAVTHEKNRCVGDKDDDLWNPSGVIKRCYRHALKLLRYRDQLMELGDEGLENLRKSVDPPISLTKTKTEYFPAGTMASLASNIDQNPGNRFIVPTSETIMMENHEGHFVALMKICDYQEASVYRHSLQSAAVQSVGGKRFNGSLALDTSGIGHEHSTAATAIAIRRLEQCITQVRATFQDRTIMKFDLANRMFHVILPSAEESVFSLSDYQQEVGIFGTQAVRLLQLEADMNAVTVAPQMTTGGGGINVVHLAHCVRRLLSFYRWASTPAEHRTALVQRDAHTARIARAAALQANRHLLMQQVSQHVMRPQEAFAQSQVFEASLQRAGEDPTTTTPIAKADTDIDSSGSLPVEEQLLQERRRVGRVRITPVSILAQPRFQSIEHTPTGGNRECVTGTGSLLTSITPFDASHSHVSTLTPPSIIQPSLQQQPLQPQQLPRKQVATLPAVVTPGTAVTASTPSSSSSSYSYSSYSSTSLSQSMVRCGEGEKAISQHARQKAGDYLYHNVSINANNDSFGSHTSHDLPPGTVPVLEDTARLHRSSTRHATTTTAAAPAANVTRTTQTAASTVTATGVSPVAAAIVTPDDLSTKHRDIINRNVALTVKPTILDVKLQDTVVGPTTDKMPNYTPNIALPTARYLGATYVNSALEQSSRVINRNENYVEKLRNHSLVVE